jgi:group II intron reverse transcriptase/maturase
VESEQTDIKELSKKYDKLQTLMHRVNKVTLFQEHQKQIAKKAVGVDGVTKEVYDRNLESNIDELMMRLKQFSYRPQPVRRTYIPKGDGKLRPLGIPAYEDKLVQGCMAKVLNDVYEPRFLDFSYGFRPERDCHMAIKEINNLVMTKKVNYILDADIKGFFDNVDHTWLVEFLENDIQDKNLIRYIVRFLKAGVIEDLKFYESDKGTPQGGLISPVCANIYLHYVLDLWFEKAVKPNLRGESYMVRYADDFVLMFQFEDEAKEVYVALEKRLEKFGLELAKEKTRVIPFGRFAKRRETFDFLGFKHINGVTRNGKYTVVHRTSSKKMKAKKQAAKIWLHEHMHQPIDDTMKSLRKKLTGHFRYYGINRNFSSLSNFVQYVRCELFRALNRRHQKRSMSYEVFNRIWAGYNMPRPKLYVSLW